MPNNYTMPVIQPYLRFSGNCLAAFTFYEKVFRTRMTHAGTFKDLPPEYAVEEKNHHLIMHATLPIGPDTLLLGSDTSEDFGPLPVAGTNFSLSVKLDSEEEARRVFHELSAEGKVQMPMAPTFWGSLFGTLTDRFDIHWMVAYDLPADGSNKFH